MTAPPANLSGPVADWVRSLRLGPLWLNLALEDLRDRYRRTTLGMGWIVASFALFVLVKVEIFGQLSTVSPAEFGVFVTIGFGLWTYLNAMVVDACTAYIHARPWILGTSTPYPVFVLQTACRNWLMFCLVLLVMAAALYWKPSAWTPTMLWSIPGLLVYPFVSVWLTAILAPLSARYRDLYHAVQTSMRLIFFATPILWMPSASGKLALIAEWNPMTHMLAIVRDPVLYDTVPLDSWLVVAAINVLGIAVAAVVYARTRRNLSHWV